MITPRLFKSPIKQQNINDACEMVKKKFGQDTEIIILIDELTKFNINLSEINNKFFVIPDVVVSELSSNCWLSNLSKSTVVVYAVSQDDIGLPYISMLHDLSINYIPVWIADPGYYVKGNLVARIAIEEEFKKQTEQGFAKFDFGPSDFVNIVQALDITENVPGAFVEIGCFRGSSSCAALNYIAKKNMNLECYFLDVFNGFDYLDAHSSSDCVWENTHGTEGFEEITKRLKQYEHPNAKLHVNVLKNNIISDNLPEEIVSIRVANLDVDLYEAVFAGLTKLAPRMSKGGVIIVEDPGHTPLLIGARLALKKFLDSDFSNLFLPPIYMQSGQFFLIRTQI